VLRAAAFILGPAGWKRRRPPGGAELYQGSAKMNLLKVGTVALPFGRHKTVGRQRPRPTQVRNSRPLRALRALRALR
jgi:hypothetical protein